MRWITLLPVFIIWSYMAIAEKYTGVYTFSKGMNKANGTLYVYQWSDDSAFILLQAVSGMPDFFTAERKGFISIQHNVGSFYGKDSCHIEFEFGTSACSLTEKHGCSAEFNASARYKRTQTKLKKGTTMLPGVDMRNGIVNRDSVICYAAPHRDAERLFLLNKAQEVQITDEYNGFYLVEMPKRRNEFLWIPKKLLTTTR